MKKNSIKNKVGIESPETITNSDGVKPEEQKLTKRMDEEVKDEAETVKPEEEKLTKRMDEEVKDSMDDDNEDNEDGEENDDDVIFDKIKSHLGLDEDADSDTVLDALKSKTAEHEALKVEHAKLQDKLQVLADEAKKAHKTKIDAMVNQLLLDGKIEKSDIGNVTELANVNFEAVKNLYSKVSLVKNTSKLGSTIDKVQTLNSNANWNIRDWEKKDPKGLLKLKQESPSIYQDMYDSYYKNKK